MFGLQLGELAKGPGETKSLNLQNIFPKAIKWGFFNVILHKIALLTVSNMIVVN